MPLMTTKQQNAARRDPASLGIDEVGFTVKLPRNTSLWSWQTHAPASTAPGLVLRNNMPYVYRFVDSLRSPTRDGRAQRVNPGRRACQP